MLGIQSFFSACCLIAAIHQPIQLLVTESSEATLNQSVTIQIQELDPFSEIELEARTTDQKGETWTSHASFQADKNGLVNLSSSQPLLDLHMKLLMKWDCSGPCYQFQMTPR